jgi:hypothetical protein
VTLYCRAARADLVELQSERILSSSGKGCDITTLQCKKSTGEPAAIVTLAADGVD